MAYYFLLLAYMVLIQYAFRDNKGNDGIRMVFTFLPLFIFGALRVHCGDYEAYEDYNFQVRTTMGQITDVIERMEPGYAYLNKLLSYRWIIVLSSLLACFAYGIFFTKVTPQKHRWFGIFIFFLVADKTFYFMFSSIRNSISMSILLIYMTYRFDKRSKKHSIVKELIILVIITAFASMFHASAKIFFPIAFFATINKKISNFEFYVWITILIILWILPVDLIIEKNFLFQTDYFSRYDYYIYDKETRNAGLLAKFGATIFAVLCLINIRLNENEEKKWDFSRLMLVKNSKSSRPMPEKNSNSSRLMLVKNSKSSKLMPEKNSNFSRLMLLYIYSYMLGSINMRVSYYFIPYAIVYLTFTYIQKQKSIWAIALLSFAIVFMFYSSFIAGSFASAIYSPFINYRIDLFQ